jgi:hypothetical protein
LGALKKWGATSVETPGSERNLPEASGGLPLGCEEKGLFPSQGSGGAYRTIAEEEIGEGKWMKTGLEKSFSACPLSCERFPAL